jgi:hypothetical protein
MRIGIRTFRGLCLAAVIVCAAALSSAARGQGIDLDANRLAVSPVDSSWRFHPGDDPQWSQPDFDDSAWTHIDPRTDWSTQGYARDQEFAWFRFRLRVPAQATSLVLELPRIHRNYQLFSDGRLIGQSGKLPPEHAQMVNSAARVFTLPIRPGTHPREISVAIRLWQDPSLFGLHEGVLLGRAYAGEAEPLLHQFALTKDSALLSRGNEYTQDVLSLIVGAATLLLFWLTRERFYLWFALYLVANSLDLPISLASQHLAWPFWFTLNLYILTDFIAQTSLTFFIIGVLGLRGRRLALLLVLLNVLAESGPVLVNIAAVPVIWGDVIYFVFETTLMVLLFWFLVRGWRKGNVDAKLLLIPYSINSFVMVLNNFGNTLVSLNIPHGDAILIGDSVLLRQPFQISLGDVAAMLSTLGMLAVLVYRFARTNRERQRLASALQAAHDIQNRLVPVDIPTLGGLHTEIAYRAAEEVGGDFCQILPRPDGSIFVAIGDVSGKGLQAAMLGAVAVGALRSLAEEDISPAVALERLNRVLLATKYAGFTTCLCLILTPAGEVTIANAGHLSPYLDGAEVSVSAGLPLGVIASIDYELATLLLPDSARLTRLSDGVVEARSAAGELFGFERTAELSRFSAPEIADRAYEFGQQDDITVITLDWQSVALPALSSQRC